MRRWNLRIRGLGLALACASLSPTLARAENLQQAWSIALNVNNGLQAQQQTSISSGFQVQAAESARWFTLRSFNVEGFNFQSSVKSSSTNGSGSNSNTGSGSGSSTRSNTSNILAGYALGGNNSFLPVSLTFASLPIYTGGQLKRNVDAARFQLGAQRANETQTAIELKLTVAEAYISVLRAKRNLDTARSNVEQLASFARDVRNRLAQGLAIRSDDLAAQVSLANAQISEIQARTTLESAWATYNRYLCRPLDQFAPLEEISVLPTDDAFWQTMAAQVVASRGEFAGKFDAEARDLTVRALELRPELASLAQQARALNAQAAATRAGLRPQVSAITGLVFLGGGTAIPQETGFASIFIDWTITDSGKTRRNAASQTARERAALRNKADLAADVALQVRTRWLDLQQAKQRVPVARFAVIQSEENVKVVTDRYRQQLSTYTEVLDAENRRITSLNNFYNAVYDENLADFRLHRAVGDI
jgi:outer membrane protein